MTAKPFDTPGGCGLFDTIPPELRSAIYDELPNEAWVRHPDIYVHASGEQEVDPRRGPSYFGSGSELISTNKALGREVVRTRGEHFKNHMLKLTIDVSSTRANGWSAVENIASIIPESAERLVLLLKWKYTWWRGWRAPTKALDQIFDLSNLPKLRKLVVLSDTTEMDTLHILRIAFLRDISHDHCGCPCALPARLLYQLEIKVVLSAKFSEYSILRRRQALPFVRSAYQKVCSLHSHLLRLLMGFTASREWRVLLRLCAMGRWVWPRLTFATRCLLSIQDRLSSAGPIRCRNELRVQ